MKNNFIFKAIRYFLMLDVYDHSSDNDKKFIDMWMFVNKLAFAQNKLINLIVQVIILMVKKARK